MTDRAYAGEADLQAMMTLLIRVRPLDRLSQYPSAVDLQEALALDDVRANTRLWFDSDSQLIAFAYLDRYHNLRFELDPSSAREHVQEEVVAWGTACLARIDDSHGKPLELGASCREDDTARIAMLERHGFVRQSVRSLRLTRPLTEPIPMPQLPAGFHIRSVMGEQEVVALVALHRAAFGTTYMTVEARLAMMRVPGYDSQLDLVAIAPDGRLAAGCVCSTNPDENRRTGRNEGYTDPIVTHPDFRRRGLARALLLTGMHKLRERGVNTAVLGTSSENAAMLGLAQATGFEIRSTTLWFARETVR